MWFSLSLLSAFGQALTWALKKKSLANRGINNSIGFLSCAIAGLVFVLLYLSINGAILPPTSPRFWNATAVVVLLGVLATWSAYRALDIAALSFLMPFIALSALGLVPIEYMVREVIPNGWQIVGIIVLVGGAIIFSVQPFHKVPLRAVLYFSVTVVCYSITPAFAAVAVRESGSPLFFSALQHIGMSLGFILLLLQAREVQKVRALCTGGEMKLLFGVIALTGVVIALLENGPNMIALGLANASEVMAVKRTMPFFALVLGVAMFQEKVTRRHIAGTVLLVVGSMLVVWFK